MQFNLSRRTLLLSALTLAAVAAAIPIWLHLRQMEGQYFAPRFTCACGYRMILDFHDGQVHLFNTGHGSLYAAGTYERLGDHWVWHLPAYQLDLRLEKSGIGLHAQDPKTGRALSLDRSLGFTHWDGQTGRPAIKPLESYVKSFGPHFDPP